jgi:two-component system OmpR family response regulator
MDRPLKRILFIEDEDDIRRVAKMALTAIGGFEVVDCASGAQGLAQAQSANADVVLLDVMMPGMDGPTTLRELRKLEATADTPVVFMTARVQPREIEGFKAMGAIDVIPKPFSAIQLSDDLRRIWARCEARGDASTCAGRR